MNFPPDIQLRLEPPGRALLTHPASRRWACGPCCARPARSRVDGSLSLSSYQGLRLSTAVGFFRDSSNYPGLARAVNFSCWPVFRDGFCAIRATCRLLGIFFPLIYVIPLRSQKPGTAKLALSTEMGVARQSFDKFCPQFSNAFLSGETPPSKGCSDKPDARPPDRLDLIIFHGILHRHPCASSLTVLRSPLPAVARSSCGGRLFGLAASLSLSL